MAMSHRTLPTVVDRKLLTELLVDVSVGEQVRTRSPAQLLAAWVVEPPRWSPNISQLVRDAMPTLHGDEGRLLSWALAEPEARLRELVVHGAVLTVEAPELPKPAWGPLWKAATEPPDRNGPENPATYGCPPRRGDAGGARRRRRHVALAAADRIGRECLTPTQLQTSRVLPLAFSDRCHSLAAAGCGGQADQRRRHRLAGRPSAPLGCTARIWRCSRPWRGYLALSRSSPSARRPICSIRFVTTSEEARSPTWRCFSFAERSRAASTTTPRRARSWRRAASVVTARTDISPTAWQAGTRLRCIEKASPRSIACGSGRSHRSGRATPNARLFLVVLDGCSYPVFLELLHALSQDNTFPLGMKPDADGRVVGLPALSPLPTVTSHARGAIFLGELPNDPLVAETVFRDQDEAKTDKARFNQNAALGTRSRRLFLKADLADGGQGLLAALEDESLSVVGAVFNAVDDQIGSSNTGATVRLAPEDITAFKPALRVALKAGRKVLVTADHGHSPYIDKSLRAGNGKTPRYLPLGKHDAVPEGFIEIDLGGSRRPSGAACVRLAHRALTWAGLRSASTAVADSRRSSCRSRGSSATAFMPTSRRGGTGAGRSRRRASSSGRLRRRSSRLCPRTSIPPKPKAQLSLFNPADKAGSLPLPPALLERLSVDEKSILVLLRENGSARASELAERLNKNPGRLNGLMRGVAPHAARRGACSLHRRGASER